MRDRYYTPVIPIDLKNLKKCLLRYMRDYMVRIDTELVRWDVLIDTKSVS